MPVNIQCPSCRELLDIPDQFLGKDVRCSVCRNVISIPSRPGNPETPVVVQPSQHLSHSSRQQLPPESGSEKSNGLVWFLLLMTLVLASLAGIGVLMFTHWTFHPKMKPSTDTAKAFRILIPGQASNTTTDGPNGEVRGIECQLPMRSERYWVKYYDLAKKNKSVDEYDQLATEMDRELKSMNFGTEVHRSQVLYDNLPTLDVMFEKGETIDKHHTILRAILAENRVYFIGVQTTHEPQAPHLRRYFLSFELTNMPEKKAP